MYQTSVVETCAGFSEQKSSTSLIQLHGRVGLDLTTEAWKSHFSN